VWAPTESYCLCDPFGNTRTGRHVALSPPMRSRDTGSNVVKPDGSALRRVAATAYVSTYSDDPHSRGLRTVANRLCRHERYHESSTSATAPPSSYVTLET
jgi:hypothetical protein